MPSRHHLDPSTPPVTTLPSARAIRRLAVPGLLLGLSAALAAGLVPELHDQLMAFALVCAAPSAIFARRHAGTGSSPREHRQRPRRKVATIDALTGAGDVAAWNTALTAEVASPGTEPFTILRLTLEQPVPHADQPEAPARQLVAAAVRWQEILRPGDLLARLGDKEFGVLLPRCSGRAVSAVIGRLTDATPDGAHCLVGTATRRPGEDAATVEARAEHTLRAQQARVSSNPVNDPSRLAAVADTGLATRETLGEFDDVARSVAWLLVTPVVLITLFDESWQHFIGEHGLDQTGGPRDGLPASEAICRQTIVSGQPVVLGDLHRHPSLSTTATTRAFEMSACASVPITDAGGHVLGTVCTMKVDRHCWTADEIGILKLTASRVAERIAERPLETAHA